MTAVYNGAKHVLYHATCFCKAFKRKHNHKKRSWLPSDIEKWARVTACLALCVFNYSAGSVPISLLGSSPLIDGVAHMWCRSRASLWKGSCCEHSSVQAGWLSGLGCTALRTHESPSVLCQQDLHDQSMYMPSSMALSWWSTKRAFSLKKRNDRPRTSTVKKPKQLLVKSWGYITIYSVDETIPHEEVLSLHQLETDFGFKS